MKQSFHHLCLWMIGLGFLVTLISMPAHIAGITTFQQSGAMMLWSFAWSWSWLIVGWAAA